MKTEWSETAIRKELARLDEKTGLHGARLPISFSRAYTIIGQFSARGEGEFRFSTVYFRDPTWPVEEALNVIRHEYAHYMDYALYDGVGHGSTWKKCCTMIGAVPQRCYSSRVARLLKEKHDEEAKLSELCDAYHVGDRIEHPKFGSGVIEEITGESVHRLAVLHFDTAGKKTLGLAWVHQNCRKCL